MNDFKALNHKQPTPVTLKTTDGYAIQAMLYPSDIEQKAKIIIAGATGVRQRFYQAFAEFAATQGYSTLTLDYRGIGLSKPESLKGFQMNYLDWAHQDLAAAVNWMASDTATPLFMIGHSFGGHAFGLLPNHRAVTRFYTFGTGAGWHGWMPPIERLKVRCMWHIIGPILVKWKGYLAWSKLGMGEDLPLSVYEEWKHWCTFPHYFFDDPTMTDVKHQFSQVKTPIIAANATDDLWAMPQSRDAFMSGYPQGIWHGVTIDPHTIGMRHIGHMGYFRRQAHPLWQNALNWFDEHLNNSVHS